MKTVGIIPARYASSRFEGKALADILGKPMIERVHDRAKKSKALDRVMVATDDRRIFNAVQDFGGEAVMTPELPTGTDRVAFVAKDLSCDIVANIQGDEPLLEPTMIDEMIEPFYGSENLQVSTLRQKIRSEIDYRDTNVVKVTFDRNGFIFYFSRASIPGNLSATWNSEAPNYRHVGLYAYRKNSIVKFPEFSRTPCEIAEGLEQLRFLENGIKILSVETEHPQIGVDTPADLERVIEILQNRSF